MALVKMIKGSKTADIDETMVELAKAEKCTAKIIIGGAVISQSFADEIHADGYSADANECVKLVDRLLGVK